MANHVHLASEHACAKSIYALATLCKNTDIPPKDVVESLKQITLHSKCPFSLFEKSLARIQRIYTECIGHLRRLPEKERAWVHKIIQSETEYHRNNAFVPIFTKEIEKIEKEMQQKAEAANQLGYNLDNQIGEKGSQRTKRELLLKEKTLLANERDRMKELRDAIHTKGQIALNEAKKNRLEMRNKSKAMDISMFSNFEKIIDERERIKAIFFLNNGWPTLFLDSKVQNAFDAILRAAFPSQKSWWQWICCCCRNR